MASHVYTNILSTGTANVSYEVHTLNTSPELLNRVGKIIRRKTGSGFAGTWMVVAEWREVTEVGGVTSLVSNSIL